MNKQVVMMVLLLYPDVMNKLNRKCNDVVHRFISSVGLVVIAMRMPSTYMELPCGAGQVLIRPRSSLLAVHALLREY